MNRTASVFRLHLKDKSTWLYVPWTILLTSFLVNLLIFYLIDTEGDVSITGGLTSIFIYMMVFGILVIPQTFLYSLGMGIRRTDFFWGTTAFIGSISLANSIVLVVLSALERSSIGWGDVVTFYSIPVVKDYVMPLQIWFFCAVLLHMFFLGFLISAVHRRFGAMTLTLILGVLFVAITSLSVLATYYGWWGKILNVLSRFAIIDFVNMASVLTLVYMGLSYLLLRRSTV